MKFVGNTAQWLHAAENLGGISITYVYFVCMYRSRSVRPQDNHLIHTTAIACSSVRAIAHLEPY